MALSKVYIKLILALKIRALREDNGLDLTTFATLAGVSKSYLNEIENAKKYPQADKLMAIAQALNVAYNDLVSLDLPPRIQYLNALFKNDIINSIPFETFGLDEQLLADLLLKQPEKGYRLIMSINQLSEHTGLPKTQLISTALATHKGVNYGYFEDVEAVAAQYAKHFSAVNLQVVKAFLQQEYAIKFAILTDTDLFLAENVQAIFKKNTLYWSPKTSEHDQLIIGLKLLYYKLKAAKVPAQLYTQQLIDTNLDTAIIDAEAIYFANAILLPKPLLKSLLTTLKQQPALFFKNVIHICKDYNVTSATLLRRISYFLYKSYNVDKFMLFLANKHPYADFYETELELKFMAMSSHQAMDLVEHFCTKSIAHKILQSNFDSPLHINCQRATLSVNDLKMDLITLSALEQLYTGKTRSVNLVIVLNTESKQVLKQLLKLNITTEAIGFACQSCKVEGCEVRKCEPYIVNKSEKNKQLEAIIKQITA